MVWYGVFLKVVTRPVLIPITVGAFGLSYGTYSLTYQGTSFLGNAVFGAPKVPIPTSTKAIASGCGITTGVAVSYIAKMIYPNNWVSPTASFQYNGVKDIIPMFKNSISSLKEYPIKRLSYLVLLGGVTSGVSKAIFERMFVDDQV